MTHVLGGGCAAQTHAIVLCAAVPNDCMISASFLRMYAVCKSKWTGPPPFTVLSLTNAIADFYINPDEGAHWRNVRRASRAWRQRDAKLLEVFGPTEDQRPENYDLDQNASCIIMTGNLQHECHQFFKIDSPLS